ncbi:MAG: hypothetical protein IT435_20585 [Phycisphaerales bacterium]|nr:hypothetical protein [Phycisphaerales bacterium]
MPVRSCVESFHELGTNVVDDHARHPPQAAAPDNCVLIPMRFSRTLAIVFGILTPLAETIRRWHTWNHDLPALIDDYIVGILLLLGAWAAGRDPIRGRQLLAGAWGFVCGIGYGSVIGQLQHLRSGVPDPGPLPSIAVLWIKLIGWSLAILAFLITTQPWRCFRSPTVTPSPANS